MNRRELLVGAAAIVAAATAADAIAETHQHEHGGAGKRNKALIKSAGECVETGQDCAHHCLVLLGEGDKSLAACAKSVSDLVAVCSALQQLASAESPYLAEMAKLSMKVCEDCEKECKKPEVAKHEECKACADACAACYKECRKIVG